MRLSAALLDARVDLRHAYELLHLTDRVVVIFIGLGRSCEAEDGGREPAGDDGGKTELLHFGAFFFLWLSDVFSSGFVVPLHRHVWSNQEVKVLIPLAENYRQLAESTT
jgi:hypothetical protein